jgi:hypothetical protein
LLAPSPPSIDIKNLIIPLREAINTFDGLALFAKLYDFGRGTTHVC